MDSNLKIAAFTSICEPDADLIPQYLNEVERLRMPFVIHFDRCPGSLKDRMRHHGLCIGYTHQDNPQIEFDETHKQMPLDFIQKVKFGQYDWAMTWDIDETFEPNAIEVMQELRTVKLNTACCRIFELWGDNDHIRVDGPCEGHYRKTRFYRMTAGIWRFWSGLTNGAKMTPREQDPCEEVQLACFHHGIKTKELRQKHKERWDRIYSKVNREGVNPYGFWDFVLDESITPTTILNPFSTLAKKGPYRAEQRKDETPLNSGAEAITPPPVYDPRLVSGS